MKESLVPFKPDSLGDDAIDDLKIVTLLPKFTQGGGGQCQDQKHPAHKVPFRVATMHPSPLEAAHLRSSRPITFAKIHLASAWHEIYNDSIENGCDLKELGYAHGQ